VSLLLINADYAYAIIESAPTLDSVTVISSTQIDLSWTPAGDGGEPITSYRITHRVNGGGWTDLVADTGNTLTTYSDTTLSPGDTVQYRIRTINASGTSPPSNILGATTPSSASGDSCSGDCTSPTLGLSKNNHRIVTDGFSYNYKAVDVNRWHTEYPLIVIETGKTNVLRLKIYDDWGIDNIKGIRVAFGVPEVGSFYNGETIIEYYPNSIVGPQVNVIDKNHLLDVVKIKAWKTNCNDSETSPDCLMFRMDHIFREAPLANVIGITVSDKTRNGAQFYFNNGIEVEGDSLNPPKTVTIPLHTRPGGSILLTQIDRGNEIWIDENENIWTKNSYDTWFKLTPDEGVLNVMTRLNDFSKILDYEKKRSLKLLNEMHPELFEEEPFAEINNIFAYDFSETEKDRLANTKLKDNFAYNFSETEKDRLANTMLKQISLIWS